MSTKQSAGIQYANLFIFVPTIAVKTALKKKTKYLVYYNYWLPKKALVSAFLYTNVGQQFEKLFTLFLGDFKQ